MNTLDTLESIFSDARQLPPAERAAFLDDACRGDIPLRQQLERMLAADAAAGSFLETPPSAIALSGHDVTEDYHPITERPGDRIGRYKLLQQIGEGGFGIVYMAEQERPVRRKVALKIIKPGMDTKEVIARFESERQALALMDHPNIAKVLDAGTTGEGTRGSGFGTRECDSERLPLAPSPQPRAPSAGRPFFVMELVRGLPITDYCNDNHLSLEERLQLFIQVCHAVQHAHQKGIIHRDLKPSNVMVTLHDDRPVPKVIDFGIAKATSQQLTDKTLFTAYGQMIGTLEYMSPEQAAISGLDIDTRSDVYSLGVLLYELLTGTTPLTRERLKTATYDEIRRLIREEEPETVSARIARTRRGIGVSPVHRGAGILPAKNNQPPDTAPHASTNIHARLVPNPEPRAPRPSSLQHSSFRIQPFRELDWITAKSLEKDRERRYESPSAFATDIHRYLDGEPVQACPPSMSYRFRKFAAKHKVALTTAAAIAASLLICTAVSAWQAVEANTARQVATERMTNEQKARREAELQYQRAERERQRAESERLRAESERQRAESERDRAESHARKIEEQRQSLENYQRVNALVAKEVIGVVEMASTSGAKRHSALLQLLSRLNDLDIDPSERVTAYHSIGNQFVTLKEHEGALAAYREGLMLDTHHAGIYVSRGDLFYQQGKFDQAAEGYSDAIKSLRDADPANYMVPYARRGHVRVNQGKTDEAMADFWTSYSAYPQQTITLLRQKFLNNAGSLFRFPKLISRGNQLQPPLLGLLDRYVEDQKHSLDALDLRADVLGYTGQLEGAREDYEEAIEKGSTSWVPYHSLVVLALKRGNAASYQQVCQRMLAKSADLLSDEFKLMAAFSCGIAPEALDDFRPAIKIARNALTREPQRGFCSLTLGLLLLRDGQFDEARQQLEAAAAKSGFDSTWHHAPFALAISLHRLGQTDSAREQLSRANARGRPPLIGSSWRLGLVIDILHREAAQLINAPKSECSP